MAKIKTINPLNYINGIRGAIALFLAILMTPFLTIAMVLVETGRYNSSVSVLDEAMGVSAVSTLANYDQYLQNRWGLLAVSQDKDIATLYRDNLEINKGVLGDSLDINSLEAKGIYPLSDSEILYNQIMEYSKWNSPTTLAMNALNLPELIQELEKILKVANIFDAIKSGADMLDSGITLSKKVYKLKDLANDLDDLKTEYSTNYTAFETNVNNLIDALAEGRPDEEKYPEAAKAYDERIVELRVAAVSAQSNYAATLGSIGSNLQSFKDNIDECNQCVKKIGVDVVTLGSDIVNIRAELNKNTQSLKEVKDNIEKMDQNGVDKSSAEYLQALDKRNTLETKVAELQTKASIATAGKNGLSDTANKWEEAFKGYSDDVIEGNIQGFGDLKTKVENFNIAGITAGTEKVTTEQYKSASVSGYIEAEDIDDYIKKQEEELVEGSLAALIDGITTFFNSTFKFSLAYNPALSANINVAYYNETFGGLPGDGSSAGSILDIMTHIGLIIRDSEEFKWKLAHMKIFDAYEKLEELMNNVVGLLESIALFVSNCGKRLFEVFTSYDALYYTIYTAFNLPCRTDYKNGALSFKTMTGYSLKPSTFPEQNINSNNLGGFDDLAALIDLIKAAAAGSGDDITFSGAELEYIIYGSKSEIANQSFTFCALYLIRFLLDVPAVCLNAEVEALASAATIGYPLVIALMLMAEPLVETLLLVNGDLIPIYSTTIYLTPTGLPELLTKLITVCKFTTKQKQEVAGGMIAAFDKSNDDYQKALKEASSSYYGNKKGLTIFKCNYREHCFIWLLLCGTRVQQMGRLSDLIQMETLSYYNTTGASYTFDLRNSYTYIEADANVSVKQMLPSLTDSSVFTVDRKNYRGY